MMFIELANRVVEEVRRHPYWTGGDIDYYNDPTENRPINDLIMIDGLGSLLYPARQVVVFFLQLYQANLTDTLLERDIGNKKLSINIKDGGSNPAYCPPSEKQTTTSTTTTTTATTTEETRPLAPLVPHQARALLMTRLAYAPVARKSGHDLLRFSWH